MLTHIYWAIRYGKWYCGWEQWEGKPQWGFITIGLTVIMLLYTYTNFGSE